MATTTTTTTTSTLTLTIFKLKKTKATKENVSKELRVSNRNYEKKKKLIQTFGRLILSG